MIERGEGIQKMDGLVVSIRETGSEGGGGKEGESWRCGRGAG